MFPRETAQMSPRTKQEARVVCRGDENRLRGFKGGIESTNNDAYVTNIQYIYISTIFLNVNSKYSSKSKLTIACYQ